MGKDTLITRHKKLFLLLGVIESCSILIMAIALLFLPLASFNLTKLDSTKVSFNFFKLIETNPLIVVGFFLLCCSIIPTTISKTFIQKDTWKEKLNIMTILTIVAFVLFVIGTVVFYSSIMEYTEPNTNTIIILEKEVGAYLFWVGLISIAIGAYELVCLKLIKSEKYTEEQLFGRDNAQIETITTQSLEDKLNELSRLKQSGIITQDEYAQKKKELLDL
ncbi:MAG: SHOCT domain-containing protein [Clostridia bacterium]